MSPSGPWLRMWHSDMLSRTSQVCGGPCLALSLSSYAPARWTSSACESAANVRQAHLSGVPTEESDLGLTWHTLCAAVPMLCWGPLDSFRMRQAHVLLFCGGFWHFALWGFVPRLSWAFLPPCAATQNETGWQACTCVKAASVGDLGCCSIRSLSCCSYACYETAANSWLPHASCCMLPSPTGACL